MGIIVEVEDVTEPAKHDFHFTLERLFILFGRTVPSVPIMTCYGPQFPVLPTEVDL